MATTGKLAQYKYLLPRLLGMWKHLERQEGAIGTRGPGETQLESDQLLHLGHLALADEGAGVGAVLGLGNHPDRLAPRRLQKGGQLLHGLLVRVLPTPTWSSSTTPSPPPSSATWPRS